jgi:tRNA G18 (ribose-2'-O)-methylase SpoU
VADTRIETADDPRVAAYRDVGDPELLRGRGLFVAEGRLVVRRVIGHARFNVQSLLLNDAARISLAPDLARLPPAVPVFICATALFERLTGYNIHRGCLALVERGRPSSLDEVIADARLIVVLEDVGNADNVGGVFRNAAAFGADGVLLTPSSCDPLYRKAIRTSMAASLAVPTARLHDWPDVLSTLKSRGFTLVALTPNARAETLDTLAHRSRPTRIALLVGAEGAGLSEAALVRADRRVRIPIRPDVDSLNLAVAVGIALSRLSTLTIASDLA